MTRKEIYAKIKELNLSEEVKKQFGCTPKWVRALQDGKLYFVNTITQPIVGEA